MSEKKVIFRFNMVEVALALVILAIGLSSVLVLFPVGLKASRNSIADNSVGDIAERMAAYLQAKYTSPNVWKPDGTASSLLSSIGDFDSESPAGVPYKQDDLATFTVKEDDVDGLFTSNSYSGYYIYRQYSNASDGAADDNDRAVDFEAMIRVGWDPHTLEDQYYLDFVSNSTKQFKDYARTKGEGVTDDPGATRMGSGAASTLLPKFCRALMIEISWPADVEWAKREKRIFRVEIFNENFVPYPPAAGGGAGDGNH